MADFADYVRAQNDVSLAFANKEKFNKMSLTNIAKAGIFSSDRAIKEYADNIWVLTNNIVAVTVCFSVVYDNRKRIFFCKLKLSLKPSLLTVLGRIFLPIIIKSYLTDSLDSIIKENDFTHMMYLYNANTLFEDNSLISCLES